jgi:methylmalonyl-CoA mutase
VSGSGGNIIDCAADVLRLLGHNMPPEAMGEAAE